MREAASIALAAAWLVIGAAGAGCAKSDAGDGAVDARVLSVDAPVADADLPDGMPPDAREDAATGECAGKADGVACGNTAESECDLTDSCLNQECVPNHVAAGMPCGNPDGTQCDGADVCDGEGNCDPMYATAGTPCGDGADTECDGADSCDGAGSCQDNVAADGSACSDCTVGPCDSCQGGVCLCEATTLNTTFASNNGFNGNMFDVTAQSTVTVRGVDVNLDDGDHIVEVWFRAGTYVGHETSSTGWTLVGSATVSSVGPDMATPVPIVLDLQLVSGQTYGFYVVVNGSGAMNYTNGTAVGDTVTSDGNLEIKEGAGGGYFDNTFSPRIWNGRLRYDLCPP